MSRRVAWIIAAAAALGASSYVLLDGEPASSTESQPTGASSAAPPPTGSPADALRNGGVDESKFSGSPSEPVSAAHQEAARPKEAQDDSGDANLPPLSAIEDFNRQRTLLEKKVAEVTARENELKAREQAAEDEIKKLQQVRDEIAGIEAARKKEGDDRVVKVVETVESMSPKAAAVLLTTMDEPLAVAAMTKVSTAKLAKIMNLMEPAKSSRLAEMMAGVVRAVSAPQRSTASNGVAVATKKKGPMDQKGGE